MPEYRTKRSVPSSRRGASLTGYGLVVGLISIVALGAVTSSGRNVQALFGEVAGSLDSVSGGASSSSSPDVAEATPTPTPNQPPSAPQLSASSLVEDSGPGAAIGTLSATDPDPGQTVSFSFGSAGGDEGAFQIVNGSQLQASQNFDFDSPVDTGGTPADNVYVIEVIATDDGTPPASSSATLSVTVLGDGNGPACSGGNMLGCMAPDGAFFAGTIQGNALFIAPTDEDDQAACTSSGGYDPGAGCFDSPNASNDNNANLAWNFDQDRNTPADSLTNGLSNTLVLVGDPPNDDAPNTTTSNNGPHPAANACALKSVSGDRGAQWYLPSLHELRDISSNLVDTNNSGVNEFGEGTAAMQAYALASDLYWTSTENGGSLAYLYHIVQGVQNDGGKLNGFPVRCVRR